MMSDSEMSEMQKLKERIKELENQIDSWECADCGHQSLNCGGDFVNTQDYDPSW